MAAKPAGIPGMSRTRIGTRNAMRIVNGHTRVRMMMTSRFFFLVGFVLYWGIVHPCDWVGARIIAAYPRLME
jgi:hypothetical protein